jgi:excinuclease ABC subunit A
MTKKLLLTKVAVHNLKNIDITLPKNILIVFTGVSGSGKSSLAFDTIYREGQRKFLESLPHYARRFLGDFPKPKYEKLEGMSPTIAIEQKRSTKSPRSTVGTMTGIYDLLRILYARIAKRFCPIIKEPIESLSREHIVQKIAQIPTGTTLFILSPFVRQKKGECKEDLEELVKKGFNRVRVDDIFSELPLQEPLNKHMTHDIDIVIDRLTISPENASRLKESVFDALDFGKGELYLWYPERKEEILFSEHAFSPKSNVFYPPLEPQDFSFNHPQGMCPECQGLGILSTFDLQKIILPERSISEDCCTIASSYQTIKYGNIYNNLAKLYDFFCYYCLEVSF